jgi:hypothetical protein
MLRTMGACQSCSRSQLRSGIADEVGRAAAFPDVVVATGRFDLPNRLNNVLGVLSIFWDALDVAREKGATQLRLP